MNDRELQNLFEKSFNGYAVNFCYKQILSNLIVFLS
ncbi:hypothetical protein IGI80_001272 [Enterococcus sp. DIV1420a]